MKNTVKKLFILTAIIIMMCVISVVASAETYGDLTYSVYNGEIWITDCSATATEIDIPAEINGYPVRQIGAGDLYGYTGFDNCKLLVKVNIPNSVTRIAESAFYNCTSLKTINIPESITSIDGGAFNSCYSLQNVYIDDLYSWFNIDFGSVEASPLYYGADLYINDELVTDITVPKEITKIDSYMFSGCTSIKNVIIHDGVKSIEYNAFKNCRSLTDITIPDSVTQIGDYAFSQCTSLSKVNFTGNISSIGKGAFYYCNSLKSVSIPNNVSRIFEDTFRDCDLESIIIPDSVTKIETNAFDRCYNINVVFFMGTEEQWKSIKISTLGNDYLKNARIYCIADENYFFQDNVLFNATKTKLIAYGATDNIYVVPDTVKSVDKDAFYGVSVDVIVLPDNLKHIGVYSFKGSDIDYIYIPSSLSTVDEYAFQNSSIEKVFFEGSKEQWNAINIGSYNSGLTNTDICYNSKLIVDNNVVYNEEKTYLIYYDALKKESIYIIPDSVNIIEGGAFQESENLKKLIIPDSVTDIIGRDTFKNCSNLVEVRISHSLTTIKPYTFQDCDSLKQISLPDGIIEIEDGAFLNCETLLNISFPESLTAIGYAAFAYCNSLTYVSLPDSLTSIEGAVFKNCSNLEKICLSEGDLTTIPSYAFYGCEKLAQIYIPSNITAFGDSAFSGCNQLTDIYFGGTEEEWDKIAIDSSNSTIWAANVHFNHKHSFDEWTVDIPAQQCIDGYESSICTVCNYKERRIIPCTHNMVQIDAQIPTCAEIGWNDYEMCKDCDYTTYIVIPATGNHDYISVITTPATCKQAGVRTYTCTVCGDTYVEETPALGHTEEVISGKSATCTETGLTEGKKCSVCGEILVAQEEIPALGHKEEVISGKPATCTESGISDGIKCSVCGETLVAQEEIPALGHTIERIEGRFPTCTEPGLSYGEKCSVCGIIITEQTETEPWGHEETTLRGFLMPTTSSEGYSGDTICVLCSEVVKKGSVIPVKQTPVIEVSPVEGNVGDTVSVVVSGKNVIGLESFAFVFEYDETVLEFVSIGTAENAERLIGMGGKPENTTNAITFSGFWLNSHGDMCISSDSDLAVITFKIIGEGDRTVSPALNNGEWSDYYDMPPELENYCFHETEIQGFVLPSYETGGYSGDKVCIKCKEVFEYGKELPVKKQPSFEFSSTDAKVGDTVTITVNLKDSVSFSSGYLELTYDAEYLKYVDVQSNDKQLLIGMSNNETEGKVGLLLFATFSQPYTYSDTSFDLQFVVLKDGSSEMSMIQDDDWSDEFGLPPSPETYTFTTACEHVEEVIPAKSATCTAKGATEGKKCFVCGEILVAQEEIPALGHKEEVISGKSATCTETGLTEGKKCSVCNEILVAQSEIPALGHTEEVISGKSASCTETGLTEGKKCSVCGEILAEQEEIPATGHAYGEWTVVKNPTITEEGSEERTCASCGKAETRTIEKLSYLAGDINRDGKITAADARLALRIAAKLDNATEYQSIVADMNQDKKITAADARKILRISAKLE